MFARFHLGLKVTVGQLQTNMREFLMKSKGSEDSLMATVANVSAILRKTCYKLRRSSW